MENFEKKKLKRKLSHSKRKRSLSLSFDDHINVKIKNKTKIFNYELDSSMIMLLYSIQNYHIWGNKFVIILSLCVIYFCSCWRLLCSCKNTSQGSMISSMHFIVISLLLPFCLLAFYSYSISIWFFPSFVLFSKRFIFFPWLL